MTLHCCSVLAEAEGIIVRLGHIDSACNEVFVYDYMTP